MAGRGHWVREDYIPTVEELDWLASPEGRWACAEMASGSPAETPGEIVRWRDRLASRQVAAAWSQVLLRSAGRAKFSLADAMWFDRVGLEQATDETVAAYKARRFSSLGSVVDLCCGIGGDAVSLAPGRELTVMDRVAARVRMAAHNVEVYGGRVSARVGDVAFDRPQAEAAHVDPDRRAGGQRRHEAESASPGVETLQRIVEQYRNVAIKLSPGTALDSLPPAAEIELISHQGECKQAVAWIGRLRQGTRRATCLPSGESVVCETEQLPPWPPPVPIEAGEILFEPDPAVIRADLVGLVCARFGLGPIDPRIALLVGTEPVESRLLRPFRVLGMIHWSLKEARSWIAGHGIGRLEIKTRGFAGSPEEIHRRLKLPAGNGQGVLFLTRLGSRPTAILAERVELDAGPHSAL